MITFKLLEISSGYRPLSRNIARFGANVVNHKGATLVMGGIIRSEILKESTEICLLDSQLQVSQAVLSRMPSSIPRPLLIGSSFVSIGSSLLVMGGSAVCFSFGTFWNNGCYVLRIADGVGLGGIQSPVEIPKSHWTFMHTIAAPNAPELLPELALRTSRNYMTTIPKVKIRSPADFDQILRLAKPVLLVGLDLGPCTDLWTSDYLKEYIGGNREVRFT
jgi:tRNA wybutosine-synthesizing protein 4